MEKMKFLAECLDDMALIWNNLSRKKMKGREAFEESIISIMGDQRVFHSIATIAEKDVWCLREKLLSSRLYRT